MKLKTVFCIFIGLLLASCGTSTSTPTSTPRVIVITNTATQPTTTATLPPTATKIPATPTVDLAKLPTLTPQTPAVCPQIDPKLRIFLGAVFKDQKATYHDARQAVIDFLNEGGDPEWAIKKLAENGVTASQMDITHDGIKEFFLPSGYFSIYGCKDGKYVTLLDIAPTEYTEMSAIPLAIQDLNLNGIPELFIGQAQYGEQANYRILEWNGTTLTNVLPSKFQKNNTKIYIDNQIVYTTGQSNAQKGALLGNYEIVDTDENGLKEIVIHAGVYKNWFDSSDLEDTIVLKWDGKSYVVGKVTKEATPTPEPTFTPLPFSATCSNKNPNLRYSNPQSERTESSILEYLNLGGEPEQLKSFFNTTIQDFNNDSVPEILTIDSTSWIPSIHLFSCDNGQYKDTKALYDDGSANFISILAVKDNNKNGFAEIYIKSIGCLFNRCGTLSVVEWDGEKFAPKIKVVDSAGTYNYIDMGDPVDVYLRDLDNDGIMELAWVGEIPPDWHGDYWAYYPLRLATHTYKWDGEYYVDLPVEYAGPKYRFQAMQDGDLYAEAGLYEKALKSYQLTIRNDGLDWWTEDRWNSMVGQHGIGPCAEKLSSCPPATRNPDERPTLSAYATFKMAVIYLLMDNPAEAENIYLKLLKDYPEGSPAYPVTEMAITFWDEYQISGNMPSACSKATAFISNEIDTLILLTGGANHSMQGIGYIYFPDYTCPFK